MHILASLENKSEHPLAKAIVKYYKIRKNPPLKEINDFEIIFALYRELRPDDCWKADMTSFFCVNPL